MHQNIDKILRRANALLLSAWHDPATPEDRRSTLGRAYALINPGRNAAKNQPPHALPADPDGSETLTAARFVAEAMGLKVMGHIEVDEGQAIGPGHLVVLRRVGGAEDAQHAQRLRAASGAGMCVEIHCQAPDLTDALARRRKAGTPDPRQPSLF